MDAATGPTRGAEVSLRVFRAKYDLRDQIQYVGHFTRDRQTALTPGQVLGILRGGNERLRTGRRLARDLGGQVAATTAGQQPDGRHPQLHRLAKPGRTPLRPGARGRLPSPGGSERGQPEDPREGRVRLRRGRGEAGPRARPHPVRGGRPGGSATGCDHLDPIPADIRGSVDSAASGDRAAGGVVARRNVAGSVGRIVVVGAVYDTSTGEVEFLPDAGGPT